MRKVALPTDASLIITYRCPMQCTMCHIHAHPSRPSEEFSPELIDKLPKMKFINITGGEPFSREDIHEIVERAYKKSDRIVISTSGWFTEKVIGLARKFPRIGIRVSLEGLSVINDELRGRKGSFDRGLTVLLELSRMGIRDIGFGITISDRNSKDMLVLYELAKRLRMEFATAAVHNSFYFHKYDNRIGNPDEVASDIEELARRLLSTNRPKNWARAYFNIGLANFVRGGSRLLPCRAGSLNFFLDPAGEVYPCNGMEEAVWCESMGNLESAGNFEELWSSERAQQVRERVRTCPKNCWMIGTVAPVMKKRMASIVRFVMQYKLSGAKRFPELV